ncbi:hypothetical protein BH11BAC2_BH11BAC2_14670 [soil metagenome]
MRQIILLVFLLTIVGFSCQKNNEVFPSVQVNEYLDLNLPSYFDLNNGGWIYYPAGNKGLIIYRLSGSEFAVFDRTCTYDPNEACATIYVDQSNQSFATDTCCLSKYSILDGSNVSGPSSRPLVRYNADYLPNNVLHVYN